MDAETQTIPLINIPNADFENNVQIHNTLRLAEMVKKALQGDETGNDVNGQAFELVFKVVLFQAGYIFYFKD